MRQVPLERRQHPIFSPVALISSLLLMLGLSVTIYLTGGRVFSPGDLSALNHSGQPVNNFMTHAEFGDSCTQCHAPFKGIETARCEVCHESVQQQRQTGEGLHGRFPNAEQCVACHLDHRGAEFDLLHEAINNFDHTVTDFSLARHAEDYAGMPLHCAGCHVSDRDFAVSLPACTDCHTQADAPYMTAHVQDFGSDCLLCHDGIDSLADFTAADHAELFVLHGRHAEARCAGCHENGRFIDTPTTCVACHAEPAVHAGLLGQDCTTCHTTDGWKPATLKNTPFDHAQTTRFSLEKHLTNYDGSPFTCITCHANAGQTGSFVFPESDCTACHNQYQADFMTPHIAQFGDNCLSCHDGSGNMTNFDHTQVWPLTGQHSNLDCTACHINQVYAGTPRECVECHIEPSIHAGLFGTDCANCHTTDAWQPARLMEHTFPLTHGGEGEIDCITCHTTTYTAYTCYNCHEHDQLRVEQEHREEGISGDELLDCVSCHPTGREEEGEGGGGDN